MTRISVPLAAVLAAALLFSFGTANAANDDIVSTKKNIKLYSGNTAVATSPNGRKFRVYFGKDGKVDCKDSKGLSQTGKWVLTDEGMLCYDWRKWKDRCYSHKKIGDGYQSYRDGKTKGSKFKLAPGKVGVQK